MILEFAISGRTHGPCVPTRSREASQKLSARASEAMLSLGPRTQARVAKPIKSMIARINLKNPRPIRHIGGKGGEAKPSALNLILKKSFLGVRLIRIEVLGLIFIDWQVYWVGFDLIDIRLFEWICFDWQATRMAALRLLARMMLSRRGL